MFDIVKVIEASPAGEYRLRLAFSDGSSGELAALRFAEGGQMVEPLRDPAYFARVFVQMGVPTWPNFRPRRDQLHMDMAEAGELTSDAAE